MAWTGDKTNPVPNIAQFGIQESEEKVTVNRAEETRRDTDKQKDFTVSLIDIDTAVMTQLEKLQLSVVDAGNRVKVPLYYASPEKWKSIQKDGRIRDYQGKMILPALVFKRTTSDKDQSMMRFNRFLNYPVLKKYSEKNQYTQFNVLVGQNVPINDVYDIVMPDHMVFNYHFIIWTEYVEQMNKLVEAINFATEDYWGDAKRFKFRTKVESFSHTVELEVSEDRIVKTEFDLTAYGYLLPDVTATMQSTKNTTQKHFTPKKVIITMETVVGNVNIDQPNIAKENEEKWRNQNYPNLPANEIIPEPPIVISNDISSSLV